MRNTIKAIWRLLCIAASGPRRWASFALLAFIIGCQIAGIQITLRLIQWSADFYNALQHLDAPAAVTQVGIFAGLIGISAALYLIGSFARQHLEIRWRQRLTDAVLERWLTAKAYWFLQPSLGGMSIDNPDQRIAEDCREFVESILTKVLDFFISLIGLASFVTLLWQLSTFPLSFELFGHVFEIPRYMVWAAPVYVAIATGLTHALGRQMPGLLAERQQREADFRFALIRLRENAAAVALSGGEQSERRVLAHRYQSLVGNWRRVIAREFVYGLFQRPYFQTILRIPMFLALPAFLAGKVTLGGLMQVASAFQNTVTTLSWFVFNYKFASELAATTKRLHRFLDAIDSVDHLACGLRRTRSTTGALRIQDLSIFTPDQRLLLQIAMEKDPEFPDVPGVADLLTQSAQRKMLDWFLLPYEFNNPVMLPPGAPDDVLAVYRTAFASAVSDPEYLAQAATLQQKIKPHTGRDVEALVERLLHTEAETIAGVIRATDLKINSGK